MNKQIEEMAKIMNEACNVYDGQGRHIGNKCYECDCWSDDNYCCCSYNGKEAEALYNAGYRKAEDVAFEATDNFRDAIMDVFIGMCRGNDYNKVNLLQIGDAIDAVYDKQIADLKKKYESEGADESQCKEDA